MKQYRIELRREYFEERTFVDERKDIERITGLLWGIMLNTLQHWNMVANCFLWWPYILNDM